MQGLRYVNDGRSGELTRRCWGNPDLSNSKKPLSLLGFVVKNRRSQCYWNLGLLGRIGIHEGVFGGNGNEQRDATAAINVIKCMKSRREYPGLFLPLSLQSSPLPPVASLDEGQVTGETRNVACSLWYKAEEGKNCIWGQTGPGSAQWADISQHHLLETTLSHWCMVSPLLYIKPSNVHEVYLESICKYRLDSK